MTILYLINIKRKGEARSLSPIPHPFYSIMPKTLLRAYNPTRGGRKLRLRSSPRRIRRSKAARRTISKALIYILAICGGRAVGFEQKSSFAPRRCIYIHREEANGDRIKGIKKGRKPHRVSNLNKQNPKQNKIKIGVLRSPYPLSPLFDYAKSVASRL